MRAWTRTLMWAGILLACAGVGAFIAYRFPPDPFPPSVREFGEQDSATPSPQAPEDESWMLVLTSRTTHRFRVGGSCTSDWRMRTRVRVSTEGRVRGVGVAELRPGAGCDFPSAQVQARRIRIRVLGRRAGETLRIRFTEVGRRPVGSLDLGGFVKILPSLRISIPEQAGSQVVVRKRVEDPAEEIHAAITTVRLSP